jgi:hypothetical protein
MELNMRTTQTVQPKMRAALLAAFGTPSHTLRRGGGGFLASPATVRTSGSVQVEAVSRRVANWLSEEGLAEYDNPACPSCITLTRAGVETAQQLIDEARSKAGAA